MFHQPQPRRTTDPWRCSSSQRECDGTYTKPSRRSRCRSSDGLMGAHAFFRVVHQERDLEPLDERIFRVLEDRAGNNREPITVLVAALAEPMEGAGFNLPYLRIAAARAMNAIGPTTLDQERLAIGLGLEPGHQLGE